MATNKKNEFPVISDKKLRIAIRAFISTFKEHEKEYLEMGVNVEEVKSLIERFRGKAALTAVYNNSSCCCTPCKRVLGIL